ncbi:MAG: family 20 glycosylhydrolase [Patescibacteria group bacterium]
MKPRFILVLVLALTAALSIGSPFATAAGRPNTIPAMQEWTNGSGSYTFSAASQIVYNGSALAADAATFAEDLLAMTGLTIATVNGTSPGTGDIYMTLGATDPVIGDEGYLLTIGNHVTINAKTATGAFWGTRTMLQLLKQSFTIAAGTARDYTYYKERGVMVDCGRKYFTPGWFMDQIRELSYLKMNYLQMHFSDREGFRIECTSHPEVVSAEHLTKAELAQILALAAKYHVIVVPEIDMPGHATQMLSQHPELWLNGNAGLMDIGDPLLYPFVEDLVREYAPIFSTSPIWGLGTDEYLSSYDGQPHYQTYAQEHFAEPGETANCTDCFIGFVNFVDDIANEYGKHVKMWHDGFNTGYNKGSACTYNQDIEVDYWNHEPTNAINGGFIFDNAVRWHLYYVVGGGQASGKECYDSWKPEIFGGLTIARNHPLNQGGHYSIWCDRASHETEAQVAAGTYELQRAFGQRSWDSPQTISWNSFKVIINALGRSPGYGSAPLPPVDTEPPTAPANLTATAVSSSRIDLSWTAATDNVGVAGYKVFRGGVEIDTVTGTTYSDTGLSPNTTYSYYVKAFDAAGNVSAQSNTAQATTPPSGDTQAPTAPTNLEATAVSSSQINLTWTASTDNVGVTGYQVFRNGVQVGTSATTSYSDTGLQPATTYSYYVKAYDAAGNVSSQSNTAQATTQAGGGANLALGKTTAVSSFHTATNNGGMAVDGNTGTWWRSLKKSTLPAEWIVVDLGASQTIDTVVLKWGNCYARTYQIQVSPDNNVWTTVYSTTTGDGATDEISFTAVSARYVRMYSTAWSNNTERCYLQEFEIYQ